MFLKPGYTSESLKSYFKIPTYEAYSRKKK